MPCFPFAARPGPVPKLLALAQLAVLSARDEQETGRAYLFAALAVAEADDTEQAHQLLDASVELAPHQRQAWSRLLLAMRAVRPAVLDLVDYLLRESEPPASEEG